MRLFSWLAFAWFPPADAVSIPDMLSTGFGDAIASLYNGALDFVSYLEKVTIQEAAEEMAIPAYTRDADADGHMGDEAKISPTTNYASRGGKSGHSASHSVSLPRWTMPWHHPNRSASESLSGKRAAKVNNDLSMPMLRSRWAHEEVALPSPSPPKCSTWRPSCWRGSNEQIESPYAKTLPVRSSWPNQLSSKTARLGSLAFEVIGLLLHVDPTRRSRTSASTQDHRGLTKVARSAQRLLKAVAASVAGHALGFASAALACWKILVEAAIRARERILGAASFSARAMGGMAVYIGKAVRGMGPLQG